MGGKESVVNSFGERMSILIHSSHVRMARLRYRTPWHFSRAGKRNRVGEENQLLGESKFTALRQLHEGELRQSDDAELNARGSASRVL
jgi:hypothetical protein